MVSPANAPVKCDINDTGGATDGSTAYREYMANPTSQDAIEKEEMKRKQV